MIHISRILCGIMFIFAILTQATDSISQTEGFDNKTPPVEKIAESSVRFLSEYMEFAEALPGKAIPRELLCSASCIIVIPQIEIVKSRGDFAGSGLLLCRETRFGQFTEPLFYKIDNVKSFYEGGGGAIIVVADSDAMKYVLGDAVHLTADNSSPGKIGGDAEKNSSDFITYAKPVEENIEGYDLTGSSILFASRDTFNAYQETIVPIEIFISPEDVPPFLRGFGETVDKLTRDCR